MTSLRHLDSIDPVRYGFRTRPTMVRLFAAVGDCSFDAAGNAVLADVRFLDVSPEGPVWLKWDVGRILHWHPFRLRLDSTQRAGLHVNAETGEGRYLSNFKIRGPGVFVLNPSNAVSLAEGVETAVDGDVEGCVVDDVLRLHYDVRGGFRSILKLAMPRGAIKDPSLFFLTH